MSNNFELFMYPDDRSLGGYIIGFRIPALNKCRGLVRFNSLEDMREFFESGIRYCDEQKTPIPENILKAFDKNDGLQPA